jgi:uncharacterized protein (TIGR03000 family)
MTRSQTTVAVIATAAFFGLTLTAEAQRGRHWRAIETSAPDSGPVGNRADVDAAPAVPTAGTPITVGTPVARRSVSSAPSRLHLLLFIDDSEKDSGPANKAGAALFEQTLRAGVAADRFGTTDTTFGGALTADRIRARISALNVGPYDTVIGYYTGAAEFDERTRSYTLSPAAGRVPRSDLRDWLLARGAALTVLITDAPAFHVAPEPLPPQRLPAGPFNLEPLFFRNRGLVDLHAAAAEQIAFPRDSEGGLFTLALVHEIRQLKTDRSDTTWHAFIDRVRSATDRMYVDYRRSVLSSDNVSIDDKRVYREQAHQTPTALTPLNRVHPQPPAPPAPAEIIVHVPAGSKLFVEERVTKLTGTERHFETANLQPDRTYTYAIRAEELRAGRTVSQTKRVTVRSGNTLDVRFELAD